jgi:undecaprenyl-diphosphatase
MDTSLFLSVNSLAGHIDQIDDFFEFSARRLPLVLVGLMLALWFWPGTRIQRDVRQWACIAAAGASALALGVNQVVIHLWDRPRPFVDHTTILLLPPSHDPSFPSDHAAFVFAIAVALLLSHRRVGLVALAIATLVSFARVYVGEHYVSDVLAGAIIGTLAAGGVHLLRPYLLPILDYPFRLARRLHLA